MAIKRKEPTDNTDQKWIPDAFDYANVKDVLDTTYKLELVKRNALSFDGNDYVSIPHSTSLNISGSITIGAWVKFDAVSSYDGIIGKRQSSTRAYVLERGGDSNTYMLELTNVGVVRSTSTISTGVWKHIVGTYNGSTMKMYVGGTEETSLEATGSIGTNTGNVYFGREGSTGYYYFKGKIRDARIYSRELSSSEVEDWHNGNSVSNTNLEGHWKLDEGTGTTANDSSGNDNDGTITGATWNGASYKDYPPHYGNGYRVSKPLSLDSIKKVKNSNIKWTSTKPTSTDIKIYTAVSSSNTTEPNTEEKQTLYLGGATGGTFTLGDGTTNTSALAYNASASTIQTALEGIYGSGLVSVVEDTDFTITFDISIGDSNLEASFTNLTGATDPTLTVSDAVDYKKATSNSTIPGISTNQDLTGKYLWVRQELSTEDADATPRLSTLEVLIETAKKSLAFFKFF